MGWGGKSQISFQMELDQFKAGVAGPGCLQKQGPGLCELGGPFPGLYS